MHHNDNLDTRILYDEVPEQYSPRRAVRPPPANVDAGRQLQQTITGAFRRAASPSTDGYQDRAIETLDSTKAHVQALATDHEALQSRCETLLTTARYKGHERAVERLQQIQQVDNANIGQRVAEFLDRMHDMRRLFTRVKYKDCYLGCNSLADEYGVVRWRMDQLQEAVDEVAESF